ncbi:M48 family metallopeptidase [Caminibacter sp.]
MNVLKIKNLDVIVKRKPIKHIYLRVKNAKIEVSCNQFVSDDFIKSFVLKHYDKLLKRLKPKKEKEFYIKNAPEVILPLVEKYSKLMNLYPSKISFRFKSTSFGTCTAKNHIIFNYYLLDYPLEAIEYVVVHELAHIKHKNHQKEFWSLVEKYYPGYKKAEKLLKE